MLPGERFKSWVDGLAESWKDRLRGWMVSWVMKGVETTFDFFEPDLRAEVKPSLQRLRGIPGLPDDIKAILDKAIAEPSAIQFAALLPYLIAVMVGFAMGSMQPAMRMGGYGLDLVLRSARLDPASVISAWRRDPASYEKYFEDLASSGWSDDRIEALKFITLFIPTADEQTHWLAREVYEPEMVTRYGLDDELPVYEETDFSKIGVSPEQMVNKWRAHWEHASWMQVVEMLHRDLLTEEDVWNWFRVVEIPPFWRQKLIDTAYTWPTRVDVRRWWDMRTIDKEELRRLYSGMGYRGVNLDNYVLWTKVYVAFPDLIARWKNGWIGPEDVRIELKALGMPADRVEEMIQANSKSVAGAQVEEGKTLTKTEIYKGVKTTAIERSEGIDLLMDLGYNLAQAEYLLDINVAALTGSPETFQEFKDLTQKWRRAVGKEAKPMTEELKQAASEVVKLTEEVGSLETALKEEESTLIDTEGLPPEATAKRDELRVTLHRAESALAAARTHYDNLLAEWKHKEV